MRNIKGKLLPVNGAQLGFELQDSISGLRPVQDLADSSDMRAVFHLGVNNDTGVYRISVPDSVTEAEVAAVVRAHVPDPDYGKPVYADRATTMRTMPDAEFRETMIRWGKVSGMLPEVDE